MRQRDKDNHVFDISVPGEREKMAEKMNRQGISGLERKASPLKTLFLLNASGRRWEEDLWSEKKGRESKEEEMWEGDRKEKWENPPTLSSLLFLKTTLRALEMEWRISGYLGFTCFMTHTHCLTHRVTQVYRQQNKSIFCHLTKQTSVNSHQAHLFFISVCMYLQMQQNGYLRSSFLFVLMHFYFPQTTFNLNILFVSISARLHPTPEQKISITYPLIRFH